ncbi:GDP-fucose protein O-fucosyltransferase [Fragilaria crotonensis]|nr:GDP-fucose protein O-fucosyltransferase [Fragilaria crotonensis]
MAQQQHEQSQIQMLANFVMSATSKDYNSRTASSNLFNVTTGLSLNLQQQNGGADAATINDTPKEMFMKPNNPSQQLEKLLQGEYLYKENSKQETNKLSENPRSLFGTAKKDAIPLSPNMQQCASILTKPNSVQELIYWKHPPTQEQQPKLFSQNGMTNVDNINNSRNSRYFLTFEPDTGGFASQRMVLEHMIVMAYALERTLVLPSRQGMRDGTLLSYQDFFEGLEPEQPGGPSSTTLQKLYKGLRIITMQEFLQFVALPGHLKQVPPWKRTNWDSAVDIGVLYKYLRTVGTVPYDWDPQTCILSHKPNQLKKNLDRILKRKDGRPPPVPLDFQGKPTSVKAPEIERLREFLAERRQVCQLHADARVLHIPTTSEGRSLLYAPFYSFFFFHDYHQELFVKRMIRDHIRYNDVIVCAAARILDWLRAHCDGGVYDAIHIRGPSYEDVHSDVNTNPAWIIRDIAKYIPKGATLYVSTDHADPSWFDPLRQDYRLYFASDFKDVFGSLMPWYMEMVEQLICARSRTFVGTYYSTYSAYTNRLRGYYQERDRDSQAGDEVGAIASYYASPVAIKKDMKVYRALRTPLWMREFPTAWLDIDQDVAATK